MLVLSETFMNFPYSNRFDLALYVAELESALMAALHFDRVETSPRFRRSTSDFEVFDEMRHEQILMNN